MRALAAIQIQSQFLFIVKVAEVVVSKIVKVYLDASGMELNVIAVPIAPRDIFGTGMNVLLIK